MVFVWSNLCRGNANFTLTQVALNDLVMVVAFAPIVALLLGVSSIPVPWETLLLSVVMYIVIPLVIAHAWRSRLMAQGRRAFDAALARIQPFSIIALLATLVLLFAFQGETIIAQPAIIAMLAVPILLQTLLIAALGYLLNRRLHVRHDIAGPSTMIGASNFFELAVAVAIVLYGFDSGAALATVVGVLIEVPVMLWLVKMVNSTKAWYESGAWSPAWNWRGGVLTLVTRARRAPRRAANERRDADAPGQEQSMARSGEAAGLAGRCGKARLATAQHRKELV